MTTICYNNILCVALCRLNQTSKYCIGFTSCLLRNTTRLSGLISWIKFQNFTLCSHSFHYAVIKLQVSILLKHIHVRKTEKNWNTSVLLKARYPITYLKKKSAFFLKGIAILLFLSPAKILHTIRPGNEPLSPLHSCCRSKFNKIFTGKHIWKEICFLSCKLDL